ncbi:hypothetical protein B566_EDAN015202 [Ephemera danica]|nr:hypothetical protein B566_EDAN015202 [Ephemera danica]
MVGKRPNTYVYTKHLAEKLVYDASKTIPAAIFRPSIGKLASDIFWRLPEDCPVYNYSATKGDGPHWQVFEDQFHILYRKLPFSSALGTPIFSLTHYFLKMNVIQGYFLFYAHQRVTEAARSLEHFTVNEWTAHTNNVYGLLKMLSPKDAVTFNFGLKDVDWNDYVYQFTHGGSGFVGKSLIYKILRDCPDALVHTSTLFSNSSLGPEILEEVHPTNVDPENLIQSAEWMEEKLMDALAPQLVGKRPNTYVYTKHLAEKLVYDASKTIPAAIFRPSIGKLASDIFWRL